MPETKSEALPTTRIATASGRIIAVAIVIACINYASSIIITLICAILIAFVLEPAVGLLERIHIPRWLGALLMLVVSIGLLYLVVYGIYDRVMAFIQEFPTYGAPLKHLFGSLEAMVKNIEKLASGVVPASSQPQSNLPTIRLQRSVLDAKCFVA